MVVIDEWPPIQIVTEHIIHNTPPASPAPSPLQCIQPTWFDIYWPEDAIFITLEERLDALCIYRFYFI